MLPWAEMMRFAVSIGLQPQDVWSLSLKEWRWLTNEQASEIPQVEFERLMARYPDMETK